MLVAVIDDMLIDFVHNGKRVILDAQLGNELQLVIGEDLAGRVRCCLLYTSRCNRKLVQELGREPTLEEIAAELNLPIEKIIEANRTAADTLSLDMPVGDEEDTTIGSFVEDDNTPGPVDATSNAMLSEEMCIRDSR